MASQGFAYSTIQLYPYNPYITVSIVNNYWCCSYLTAIITLQLK